jgi:hypothetical protein
MWINFAIGGTIKIAIVIVARASFGVRTAICATAKCASKLVIEISLNKFRRSYTFL